MQSKNIIADYIYFFMVFHGAIVKYFRKKKNAVISE